MTTSAISVSDTTSEQSNQGGTMNPENDTQQQMAEIAAEDLIEEVSIDGMCGVY